MEYVALVTGASSGIGEATARLLARQPGVKLVLVARREERLKQLAQQIQPDATVIAADLTGVDTPARIAATVKAAHGKLNLLVNNAGARWSLPFEDGGWENVAQTMQVNFEAPIRLTEALLPLLKETAQTAGQAPAGLPEEWTAPVSIVNVASTAGRVGRPNAAAYSASKFALIGWTDGVAIELQAAGIHMGLVNPGFIATEGFPQAELTAKRLTRLVVGKPEHAAAAIVSAGPGGVSEVYVPGYYWGVAAARLLLPGIVRKRLAKGSFTPATLADG